MENRLSCFLLCYKNLIGSYGRKLVEETEPKFFDEMKKF
jgi:hypothetical protein